MNHCETGFAPLEHQVLRELKKEGLEGRSFLLAVSGGLDSVVLLEIFSRLKKALSSKITVAHIHHGGISEYRDKAWEFVKQTAHNKDLQFVSNITSLEQVGSNSLKSEADFRKLRYEELFKQLKFLDEPQCLVLGHHKDDLLETRVLRLIRGVGPQGLKSMEFYKEQKLRPLLQFSRQELELYAKERGLTYLEDPTNSNEDPLRNWLRKNWLPQLEARQKGSLSVLAKSLENISLGEDESDGYLCIEAEKLHLPQLLQLSQRQQHSVLASYMQGLGLKDYSQNHIKEVLKQLDRPEKEHSFSLLKREWVKSGEYLEARQKNKGQ